MPAWNTILVPTDFSNTARRAVSLASEVALERGAKLVLVHVTELPTSLMPETMIAPIGLAEPVSVASYANDAALAQLKREAEPLQKMGLTVEVLAEFGPSAETILHLAEKVGANLVVIGTHGRTGFAHAFLGSVAERVVRLSPIPVLTVRDHLPKDDAKTR